MVQTKNEKGELVFTVELKSRGNVKNVTLSNGAQGVLIEGTLGALKRAEFVEDVVLEVTGAVPHPSPWLTSTTRLLPLRQLLQHDPGNCWPNRSPCPAPALQVGILGYPRRERSYHHLRPLGNLRDLLDRAGWSLRPSTTLTVSGPQTVTVRREAVGNESYRCLC